MVGMRLRDEEGEFGGGGGGSDGSSLTGGECVWVEDE